jgi:hypothetical protein
MNNQIDFKLIKFVFKKLRGLIVASVFVASIVIIFIIWSLEKRQKLVVELKNLTTQEAEALRHIDTSALPILEKNAGNIEAYLPDNFDLFATLNLIERISERTNFKVDSFTLSFPASVPTALEKKQLQISGSGTLAQFMAFLKEYKLITGQIVSIDSVNLSGKNKVLTSLNINIYAYKPDGIAANIDNLQLDDIDKQVLDKISRYSDAPDEQAEVKADYEINGNPFNVN